MDWTYNSLWTDQLPPGTYRQVIMGPKETEVAEVAGCTYLNLWTFQPKSHSLRELSGVNSLVYLELTRSNIRNFEGISRLGSLKRLEAHHCLKLENMSGLLEIKGSLEWLHINLSRKAQLSDLPQFTNLKVLCLNDCGPLESLAFLQHMPHLLDFRFVGTNILDGDLTPLLDHPSLVSVGFLNKRHYNLREKEVDAHFAERREKAVEYVHRGEWRTFRYRGLGVPVGYSGSI